MKITECIEVLEQIRQHFGDSTLVVLSLGGNKFMDVNEVQGGNFSFDSPKGADVPQPLAVLCHFPQVDK